MVTIWYFNNRQTGNFEYGSIVSDNLAFTIQLNWKTNNKRLGWLDYDN